MLSINKTKISIVTVVFNGLTELPNTIESIKKQNYSNVEYIVVDGGSSDGTLGVIKKYANAIDVSISESDYGIYDAMNKGVALSSGDFVIFMNAGDEFYGQDVLSEVVSRADFNSDIIYADKYLLGSRRNDGVIQSKAIDSIVYGMVCSHQSMFFRRSVLIDNKFSLNFGTSGDYELIIRLYANQYAFCRIPDLIVAYFQAGGVSDTNRLAAITNSIKGLYHNNLLGIGAIASWSFKYAYCFLVSLFVRKS